MGLCHGARVDIGDANTRGGYEPRPRPISVWFPLTGSTINEGEYDPLVGVGYVLSPCNPQYQQLTGEENTKRLQSLKAHSEVKEHFRAVCLGPGHEEPALFFPANSMGEVAVMRLAVEYGQAEYIALLPPNFGGMQIISVTK